MLTNEINKLKEFDFIKQLSFAYMTCERLYPNYVYFSENFYFGNPKSLRKAIDYLYNNLFNSKPDKNIIISLIKEVERNTPDTEDYTTIFVSPALDACSAIAESLDFLIDKKISRIKDISTFATDTVEMYIQGAENLDVNKVNNFSEKIVNHPLMKKEIQLQIGIINFLSNIKNIDYDDIQTLLHLQKKSKGSLDL